MLPSANNAVVLLSSKTAVGGNFPCFVIAEVGQNHQGELKMAKQLIHAAKESGADCVKFQKSNLNEKFTESTLSRTYGSEHSWGKTYGEHKQYLEFSIIEFKELKKYAEDIGILFSASGMDLESVLLLNSLDVPFIKIGSGDSDNLLMIKEAAQLHKPLFISTGMRDVDDVNRIYELVLREHHNLVLLHCVSAYPTPSDAVNLRVLLDFQRRFPDIPIGYSGHELGTAISVAAVALGAKVIERHITLNKQWKGSDHACSLEPEEFRRMVNEIRQVELALGSPTKQLMPCEQPVLDKLGKSMVAAHDLPAGTQLTESMVKVKVSEPRRLSCLLLESLLGKTLVKNVKKDHPFNYEDFH